MRKRLVLVLVPFWAIAAGGVTAAEKRPNVLLIMADDQTWNDSGCYGNPDVKTPNIDRLARDGMRFTRAFTATAMCAPTRQQLYTGVFPVRNGAYPNHSKVYPGTKSLVHHLRELGYRVGISGKKHFGPGDSFPFETVSLAAGGTVARGAIEEFITRDREQPYCLLVTSHSPHLPWSAGDPSQYDPQKLTLPPYIVDTPQTRVALTKYYAEITDFDREVGQCMETVRSAAGSEGRSAGTQDDTIFIYTSEQGAQIPRGKWTCYDVGLHTALVIRWPAKVKPGSVTDAMVQYVDVVPTLIEAAGGDPAKIDTGLPGGTACFAAGAPDGGRGFDGRSFLPVLLGKTDKHHDVVFGAHTTRGIINGSPSYPVRSIRTETHKLIWNLQHDAAFQNVLTGGRDNGGYWLSWVEKAKTDATAARFVNDYQRRPEFELYDLAADPYELDNLAGDPANRKLRDSLHTQLQAWMKQQGDLGIPTELKARERQGRGEKKPPKGKKKNAK